jgi:hypothetical protein
MAGESGGGETAGMLSATPSHSFLYVECDVPADMTLTAWRDEKVRAEASGRRSGLLHRLGGR